MITDFELIQKVFERKGTTYYGDGGTIHGSTEVNVELDKNGKVVSVWFRCMTLPFTQTIVDDQRAQDMERCYQQNKIVEIHGIEIKS